MTHLPAPDENDIKFILSEVKNYLSPDISVRRGDVQAAWSGLRPLVRDPNKADTQSIARNHIIEVSDGELVTIAGGVCGWWEWSDIVLGGGGGGGKCTRPHLLLLNMILGVLYASISPGTKNIFIEEQRHTGIPSSPQGQCKGQAMAEPILIVHVWTCRIEKLWTVHYSMLFSSSPNLSQYVTNSITLRFHTEVGGPRDFPSPS